MPEEALPVRLLQVSLIWVVKKPEAQREIRSREIAWKGREWIRSRNTGPCRSVEGNVAGTCDETHICYVAIFRKGKLNSELSLLELDGLGNKTVPVSLYHR